MKDLKTKMTLITGASSGLGREFSFLYAKDNNSLFLVDINLEGLERLKVELEADYPNINVHILKADLSKLEELEKVKEYCVDNNFFINNLVNSAGFGDRCDFKDMDIIKQINMNNVDCDALLYFTRVFLDDMLKHNEGHIINISSLAGYLPGPYMCTYHACKGYVLLLGESISYELRKTNVKLLTLCPGPFNSNFVKQAHNDYTFSKIKPVDAKYVAEYGYKKSLKGKTLALIGFKNKCTVFATRFLPRSMVTKLSAKTMKKEK